MCESALNVLSRSQRGLGLQGFGPKKAGLENSKAKRAWLQGSIERKRSSLHTSQVAHQAGAYPRFSSMKQLGVLFFLLPPGWDASPSLGYPPALNSPVPQFIHLVGDRHCESNVSSPGLHSTYTYFNAPGSTFQFVI